MCQWSFRFGSEGQSLKRESEAVYDAVLFLRRAGFMVIRQGSGNRVIGQYGGVDRIVSNAEILELVDSVKDSKMIPVIKQEIVVGWPPNFHEIAERFPAARTAPGVIFSFGPVIYLPHGGTLAAPLLAHEGAHGFRQHDDIVGWWKRYLTDDAFMLEEELVAHKAEWQALQADRSLSRPSRRLALKHIAKRLSGPLYGNPITFERAKELISA